MDPEAEPVARGGRDEGYEPDADRRDFVRDHYGRDVEDPAGYDVLVNSGSLSIEQCAEVVGTAYRARFGAT